MTGKVEEPLCGDGKKVAAKATSSSDSPTTSGAMGAGAVTAGHLKPDKKSAIPEISYSSSDDDDFYDAEDQGWCGGDRSIHYRTG